jgi:hypothetical protein
MAEFDELDETLRDALQGAARPGDPAGVADAIRARVAAGDPGASVASSTAPGWGGGVLGGLAWIGLVLMVGAVGGALGVAGVFGAPREEVVSGYTVVLDDTASAHSCPGGPELGSLAAGSRVLAIARSDDTAWLGVRDPNAFDRTLWFERSVVVLDPGQPDPATLPVESCPEAVVAPIAPSPTPEETEEPGEPEDQVAPSILQYDADQSIIYQDETVNFFAVASDNVGVTGVQITWSGAHSGSGSMVWSGSEWTFSFTRPVSPNGNTTFVLRARDAAGNLSAPVAIDVYLDTLD